MSRAALVVMILAILGLTTSYVLKNSLVRRGKYVLRDSLNDGPSDIDVDTSVEVLSTDSPKAILLSGPKCSRSQLNEYVLKVCTLKIICFPHFIFII